MVSIGRRFPASARGWSPPWSAAADSITRGAAATGLTESEIGPFRLGAATLFATVGVLGAVIDRRSGRSRRRDRARGVRRGLPRPVAAHGRRAADGANRAPRAAGTRFGRAGCRGRHRSGRRHPGRSAIVHRSAARGARAGAGQRRSRQNSAGRAARRRGAHRISLTGRSGDGRLAVGSARSAAGRDAPSRGRANPRRPCPRRCRNARRRLGRRCWSWWCSCSSQLRCCRWSPRWRCRWPVHSEEQVGDDFATSGHSSVADRRVSWRSVTRGQASVEYVLLCAALILLACLLVRFQSPVTAIAGSVVGAVAPHAARPHPHRGHHGPLIMPPTHRVCWCRADGGGR